MCGNCAGGLVLLGYTVDVEIEYSRDNNFERPYGLKESSYMLHSIWKCSHCSSLFLMVEE